MTAFNKIVVTVNATNLPGRYARMEQILFGVVREFGVGEIGNVDILQETDLISAELSINTMNWKLQSKTGVDYVTALSHVADGFPRRPEGRFGLFPAGYHQAG